jgi:hypothetical protein
VNNQEKATEEWLLSKLRRGHPLSLLDVLKSYKEDGWNINIFDSTDMKFLIFKLIREQKVKLDDNWKLKNV